MVAVEDKRGACTMDKIYNIVHYNFKLFVIGFCLLLIVGVCFFSTFNDGGKVSASTSNQKYFVCVEIQEGDTLWSIADLYISEEYSSIDEYVDEIKELNDLTEDTIFCGATLVVPYYAP